MTPAVRATSCALLIAAAFLTFVPSPRAASTASLGGAQIHATMTPKVIRESTKRVEATVTVRTGAHSLRRAVRVVSPRFQRRIGSVWLDENSILGYANDFHTSGPVEQRGFSGGENFRIPVCKIDLRGLKGADATYVLAIPAHSTSRLRFGFSVSKQAPWANSTYAPIFEFGSVRGKTSLSSVQKEVSPPSPRIRRTIVPRVDLYFPPATKIEPPLGYWGFASTALPVGASLPIAGRVVPAAAGAKVSVLQNGPGATSVSYSPMASAVTAPDGTFTLATALVGATGTTFLRTRLSQAGSDKVVDDACPIAISTP